MEYNWDWGVLFREPYFGWIIDGIGWTVTVSIAAWIIAFTIGSVVGVARTVPVRWVRSAATVYVELFRNIPLLVQLFLWYFVLPEVLPREWGLWMKREMPLPEVTTAIIGLGFYTASRVAEQVRSGIEAIPRGQSMAGYATGLTTVQLYRHILVPVAYRLIVPPLTSEFLTIFKNSSLALTIGVLETTARSRQITEFTFQGFEAFTAATVIYIVITLTVTAVMTVVDERAKIPGFITGGR